MQTYGRKWRTKSACVNGHVGRSGAPFMRLNSTGDVTSVEHNSWAAADLGVQPVNNNPCNMKTCTNSRVGHWTGLSASNLTHTKTSITDVNANMFESLVDKFSVSHAQEQKLMQPQCGISGWNYNGIHLGTSSAIGMFPCHRFSNSFNCVHSGHPRTFGLIHRRDMKYCAGLGTPLMRMENQHNQHGRQRYDSSYRSHMPKHHRAELVKTAPSSEPTSASFYSKSKCPQIESIKTSREARLSDAQTDCITTDLSGNCITTDLSGNCITTDLSGMSTEMYRICQSKETNTMAQTHCEDRVSSPVDSVNIDQDITITCVENCDKPKVERCSSSARTANTCQDKVQQFTVNMRSKGASGSCGASQNAAAGEQELADMTGSCCSSQNSRAGDDPALVKSDSNIHVLFIRKNLKRGRAPASKQRRRKQQKARAIASCCPDNKASPGGKLLVECSVDIGGDSTQDDKCGKSLSFYLGVSPSSDSHPVPNGRSLCSDFVVSFSDDDDDDYDSVDGDWGDVEAELTQCNLFNYLPSAQSPVNFEVRISPVSSSESLQNKVLEDINASWNVQISVKDHKPSSKKSGKKVHFPEDKYLSVIHPMVVWSYAYQSARKGHWENFVRDRNRFQRRIEDLEDTLVPVLTSEHRQRVLEQRKVHNALASGTTH